MDDSSDEDEPVNYGTEPEYFRRPIFGAVLLEIRDHLYPYWYELFDSLGVKKEILDDVKVQYAKDPKVQMTEGIRHWLEMTNPKPTWEALVDQIRQTLLETELADRMEKVYCKHTRPEIVAALKKRDAGNQIDVDFDNMYCMTEEDRADKGMDFIGMVINLTDMIERTSYFNMVNYLCTLRCPDGSAFIDGSLIRSKRNTDSILVPLLLHSYISNRELDLIKHVLPIIHQEDVLPVVDNYMSTVTMGRPHVRRVRDLKRNFIVKCVFDDSVTSTNMEMVKTMKAKLGEVFGFQDYPFLFQFMGWEDKPISLSYQVPVSCMQLIEEVLLKKPVELVPLKVVKMVVQVNTATFAYCL